MNIAIIGCGLIGQKRAETLNSHNLIMTCDKNILKAKRLNPTELAVTDWRQVVDCEEVDLVIIATTNDLLTQIAFEAAKKGKYVLVEKPAAKNSKEIMKLFRYRELIKIGFNLRYHPAIVQAKELIDNDVIGDLMFIRAVYGHGGRKGMEKEWRFDKKISGGGELLDQGIHLIDLSRYFLGDFEKINGSINTYFWDTKLEDNAFLNLETRDKKRAFLHVSCTEWKNQFDFQIYGTRGKIHINGLGGSYGIEKITLYEMPQDLTLPEISSKEFMKDISWQDEIDDFINYRFDQVKEINGDVIDAYEALKIVDKIYGR